MWAQVMTVVGTLVGALITGLTTFAANARKAKTDLSIAQQQSKTQIEVARQQANATIEAEIEKHRREKVEESYNELMAWMDDLERTLDAVWFGICATPGEPSEKNAENILNEWPWETLRPPKSTARSQHYWSDAITELIAEFSGTSAHFHGNAGVALRNKPSNKETSNASSTHDVSREAKHKTWGKVMELKGITAKVRRTAHQELATTKL